MGGVFCIVISFKTLFFFFGFILQVSFKTRVALPEATHSPFGTATLRLAPCRRSRASPLGGQMRSAPRNKKNNTIFNITKIM